MTFSDDDFDRAWPEVVQRWPTVQPARTAVHAALRADTVAHLADVYLATACADGSAAAIAAFDTHCLAAMPTHLARLRPTADEVDEIRQHVRARLLVAEPGARPRITQYAGEGDLRAWVRVVAVRALLDRRRANDPARPTPRTLDDLADAVDPSLVAQKSAYRDHFRAAFSAAITQLAVRQRNVLRYQLIDGLTLADIGALHGVHEATASRWAATARTDLRRLTRTELATRLRLADDDVDSAMRLIDSQLDASVSRALRESA